MLEISLLTLQKSDSFEDSMIKIVAKILRNPKSEENSFEYMKVVPFPIQKKKIFQERLILMVFSHDKIHEMRDFQNLNVKIFLFEN